MTVRCAAVAALLLMAAQEPQPADPVPLAVGDYSGAKPRPGAIEGELGPGLAGAAAGLKAAEAPARAEAVRKLASPPAPHAVPAMAALLEKETDPDVLAALTDALSAYDGVVLARSMGWSRKVKDAKRRLVVTTILKRCGDRAACELLVDGIVETPPTDDGTRAAIVSAMRKMRDAAPAVLKSALAKTKNPAALGELFLVAGMTCDKRCGPLLMAAFGGFKVQAVLGFVNISKPALPTVIDGMLGSDQDARKLCNYLARRLDGLASFTPGDHRNWWVANKAKVDQDEVAFWMEQMEKDYPVDSAKLVEYTKKLEEILR